MRHQQLRGQLEKTARALIGVWKDSPLVQRHLTGIDAANNELHAGPEVFAPLYRRFRREGFCHFTFHVGEDFHHLVSGMRAIYETLEFLDLKRGNRIGHATAVGIDPRLWFDVMQPSILVAKQEWLDNLLFTRFLLGQEHNGGQEAPASIRDEIEQLSLEIYGKILHPSTLWEAWKMRKLDPLIACFPFRERSECLDWRAHQEWDRIEDAKKKHHAYLIWLKYHQREYALRGEKMMEINLNDPRFSPAILRRMQTILLKKLHEREVVIESMPTSNVRISFYKSHTEHHIWRWLGVQEDEDNAEKTHLPAICLATDDPGIFATNLRNEYAHLYELLTEEFHQSPDQAIGHLRHLATNAATYRFLVPPAPPG